MDLIMHAMFAVSLRQLRNPNTAGLEDFSRTLVLRASHIAYVLLHLGAIDVGLPAFIVRHLHLQHAELETNMFGSASRSLLVSVKLSKTVSAYTIYDLDTSLKPLDERICPDVGDPEAIVRCNIISSASHMKHYNIYK